MSEEIREMDKEFNQITVKQESASSVDEKANIASIESNKKKRAKFILWYQNDAVLEMLSLLEDCLSEVSLSCYDDCGIMPTSICLKCDTGKLKERIKSILKKAKGE